MTGAVGGLGHLSQSGEMGVVDCRVEKRPRLGILQRHRHARNRQLAKIGVFGSRVVKPACRGREIGFVAL